MARLHRGEDLDRLGDEGAGEGSARHDGGSTPPEVGTADVGEEPVGHTEGRGDGDDRSDPDKAGEAGLEVHLGSILLGRVEHPRDAVGEERGDDHHGGDEEDPGDERALRLLALYGKHDEGDERDGGHAIGLEAVCGGADRVARVVAGAVSDDAGVTGVVFLDLEDNLHEVGADVGNLGEDAAGDAEG